MATRPGYPAHPACRFAADEKASQQGQCQIRVPHLAFRVSDIAVAALLYIILAWMTRFQACRLLIEGDAEKETLFLVDELDDSPLTQRRWAKRDGVDPLSQSFLSPAPRAVLKGRWETVTKD